jgi:hexokinase
MTITEFMLGHNAAPEQINGPACLRALLAQMDEGLEGRGPIPMLPSFLTTASDAPEGAVCCVMDAGGTNLRTARAVLEHGRWRLEGLKKAPMPGTGGELGFGEFYAALARPLEELGDFERVGLCFSYNVSLDRSLDGKLDFWCKEVRVPEAVGRPVGASLKAALGAGCHSVAVLNDSVAAMLGAAGAQVGVILGTGVNVCYLERCCRIPKVPADLRADAMVISTEVGEFGGFPRSTFEEAVIAASDAPDSAPAEKQCSGGYLGGIIAAAWEEARKTGLLEEVPPADLGSVSRLLERSPDSPAARIAATAVRRAAKIAAVLCAGPILRTEHGAAPVRIAVEGSQYWRLTGFRDAFHQELDRLLPEGSAYEILQTENACLLGAALAAWAKPM